MTSWVSEKYNNAYNNYVPWVEDKVLGYWGENKTSYTAKDKLSTDVTGDKNINAIQGGVAEGVGGTLSSGGILGSVGDASSKEGVTRVEKGNLDAQQAQKKNQGSWTSTLSGGYFGGGK
ncbi:uncharacterized protein KY384_006437 [Bacidia gigantensis]|uniref:uncharacterized protein n=1 Tax=Bacidia gigantensis TaxID=2732470 RepID=UPI001D04D9CC|nr:uncharacterized protein KY384_006437 [Bacidia gigantensis]KAG8528750.1 hypothetical protein KY384_006437 [Bacidia gigantensis]